MRFNVNFLGFFFEFAAVSRVPTTLSVAAAPAAAAGQGGSSYSSSTFHPQKMIFFFLITAADLKCVLRLGSRCANKLRRRSSPRKSYFLPRILFLSAVDIDLIYIMVVCCTNTKFILRENHYEAAKSSPVGLPREVFRPLNVICALFIKS